MFSHCNEHFHLTDPTFLHMSLTSFSKVNAPCCEKVIFYPQVNFGNIQWRYLTEFRCNEQVVFIMEYTVDIIYYELYIFEQLTYSLQVLSYTLYQVWQRFNSQVNIQLLEFIFFSA